MDSSARYVRASLRQHGEYLAWLFHEAPVLQTEPYGLSAVYVDTDCRETTHVDLKAQKESGEKKRLLDSVLGYVEDGKFKDAIVIQGVAGVGESSFTLRLSDELRQRGFVPIRIRLRDVPMDHEFFTKLSEAVRYSDDGSWNAPRDVLQGGDLLRERIAYKGFSVCPYVLILDGWDEISVAVSEGYKVKLEQFLLEIRRTVLGSSFPKVRVILTGRPSDAVEDCSAFFLDKTPVLLMEPLRVEQLEEFANKVRAALERTAQRDWTMPGKEELKPLFAQYSRANDKEMPVMGVPFLAHLAFRLFAELPAEREELAADPTMLLRRVTDYATRDARRPSDREDVKVLARFAGGDLRALLHRTAAAMTVYGRDSIPREELESRLEIEDLAAEVKAMKKEHVLSTLLISFYFKAGSASFGCEFAHKSLREYLFAEYLVEILKEYGRKAGDGLPKRTPYWKDFEPTDVRDWLVRRLGDCLAAQWMRPEVYFALRSLIAWEIGRAERESEASEGQTEPCSMREWRRIREGLIDAWDWWAEGVPQRSQPVRKRGEWQFDEPYLCELAKDCLPRSPEDRHVPPEPPRVVTMDAHLGDGLFRLAGLVHGELHDRDKELRFAPSGERPEYFLYNMARINSCGWYPWRRRISIRVLAWGPSGRPTILGFPAGACLRGMDLGEADLCGADLRGADLRATRLPGADLRRADLFGADLRGADLRAADLRGADLRGVHLRGADLSTASLQAATFSEEFEEYISGFETIGTPEWVHFRGWMSVPPV